MYPKIIPNHIIIQSNPKIPNNHRHRFCRHHHIVEERVPKLSRASVVAPSPEIQMRRMNIAIELVKCRLAGKIIRKAFEAAAAAISSQIWETCKFYKSRLHETSNGRSTTSRTRTTIAALICATATRITSPSECRWRSLAATVQVAMV
ncbi:hypothetical protein TIFTF001_021446 [Ficus carica]|uniref:Uncharacterized protein n=1 Tax=Ficus carica TaxID=3494 RepID=A0AA88AFY7_FICCA|nr:hypothetical protein TIFTF001_021446 [Ficus carica]